MELTGLMDLHKKSKNRRTKCFWFELHYNWTERFRVKIRKLENMKREMTLIDLVITHLYRFKFNRWKIRNKRWQTTEVMKLSKEWENISKKVGLN